MALTTEEEYLQEIERRAGLSDQPKQAKTRLIYDIVQRARAFCAVCKQIIQEDYNKLTR